MNDAIWVRYLTDLFGPAAEDHVSGPTLIIAAHPDDETLGASWVLTHASAVHVVHVTDGAPRDPKLWPAGIAPDRDAYAAVRRREAELALAHVKLGPLHCSELGFVDQEVAEHLPRVIQALTSVVRDVRPAYVVTHPFEGGHPDHDATAIAVRASLALSAAHLPFRPRLIEMTSYHLHEGAMRTGMFLPHRGVEVLRSLSVVERQRKRRMLAEYRSQREVLAAFAADEERYRTTSRLRFADVPPSATLYAALGFAVRPERFLELVVDGLREVDLDEEALA